MKEEITLLILAGGIGSRFDGLKQFTPIDADKKFIIDYSVQDAINSGFTKVVIVLKKEYLSLFKKTIEKRIKHKIKVEYVFQTLENIKGRTKPLGTAHAILSAKNKIKVPFVTINADDFYGSDAFKQAYNFTKKMNKNEIGIIAYETKKTLNTTFPIKRGILVTENNNLKEIIECSITKEHNKLIATPLSNNNKFEINADTLTSMNMLIFNKNIFIYLEKYFKHFLKENKNLLEAEYKITDVLDKILKEQTFKINLIKTNSKWQGITYKEDKIIVEKHIKELIEKNFYKKDL